MFCTLKKRGRNPVHASQTKLTASLATDDLPVGHPPDRRRLTSYQRANLPVSDINVPDTPLRSVGTRFREGIVVASRAVAAAGWFPLREVWRLVLRRTDMVGTPGSDNVANFATSARGPNHP
jgi:hypothetical protein